MRATLALLLGSHRQWTVPTSPSRTSSTPAILGSRREGSRPAPAAPEPSKGSAMLGDSPPAISLHRGYELPPAPAAHR